jgi:Ca2+-binding EF-hand superfamily protein
MGQKINIVEDLLNHPDDEAKVKTVFKKYDTDNTGDLSKDEFTQFVKEGFFFFFLNFSVNDVLALGEDDNVLMFLRDFEQVDSNKVRDHKLIIQDGKVQYEELKAAVQKMKKSFYLQ